MPANYNAVIADTSCLILLDKIEALHILHDLFRQVLITPVVFAEYGKALPEWISVKDFQSQKQFDMLRNNLDPGEASAIVLTLETNKALLIIDDLKGRKLVQSLNLRYTGTLGLLLYAKTSGTIPVLKVYVDRIRETNFRIDEKLLTDILKAAAE